MKRFLLLGSLAAFAMACSNVPKDHLSIELNISNLDSSKAYLTERTDTGVAYLDSVDIVDGKGVLSTKLESVRLVVLEIKKINQPIYIYGLDEKITITGDASAVEFTPQFEGSALADSSNVLFSRYFGDQREMQALRQQYSAAQMGMDSAAIMAIEARADQIYTMQNQYFHDYALRNGPIGAFVALNFLYAADAPLLDSIYAQIPAIYANGVDVVKLKERVDILKKVAVGERFTDISQNDTTGALLSISDVQGKYILIDFWASWCGPCRAANPDLVALYKDFHPSGFEIVGVSLDKSGSQWKQAIVEDGLTWFHMSDLKYWENEGAMAYGIRSIPQNVLIDGNGIIISKNKTIEELRSFLSEKLN